MKIQFIGATHEVTGSCTLLEVNGRFYLVDCGMEQGKDVFQNIALPVEAPQIEAVFLTHAHIDHSGMLPKLYKDGFRGKIYATNVTCDLCNIMLRDSAYIQESEAQWISKRALRSGAKSVEPVYDVQDAEGAISRLFPCRYGERTVCGDGVEVRFTDIGHLLGSACIELWLNEDGVQKKIVFSGDVGNTDQRIIRDPQKVEDADYLVVESTYGDRLHEKTGNDVTEQLVSYLQWALDRGGNVIIPSFAVGRTQEILFALREIKQKGLLRGHEGFPVYVDSPLAVEATAIFLQCDPVCFDEETMALIKQGINPIWFDDIRMTVSADESKKINFDPHPKVIISASGMCEAGRVRHHLKHNLWQEKNLILFVGYQAEGSLGRKLLQGEKSVTLFGEEISVNARIASLQGTSGHADRDGLLNWISGFREKPQTVFVNHGEDGVCEHFRLLLSELGYRAEAPYSGTEYDLKTGKMTVFTQGKSIDRVRLYYGNSRAELIFNEMVSEGETLLRLIKTRRGRPNKENARLTSQLRELIEKWSD